jgi:hypothetical protein
MAVCNLAAPLYSAACQTIQLQLTAAPTAPSMITIAHTDSGIDVPGDGTPPTTDVEVELQDFSFVMPDEIAAGKQTWHIVNQGDQWHHLMIWQRNEGVTHEQLIEGMLSAQPSSGPPPMQWVTGWVT